MEFLKELLKEETYNALSEELKDTDVQLANLASGDYVSKSKYTDELGKASNRAKYFEAKFTTANNELNTLKKMHPDIDGLKSQFETEKGNMIKEYEGKILTEKIGRAIDRANPNDSDIVFQQLDTSKITIEDGELKGLDEQIASIKESKPFLFNSTNNKASGLSHNSHTPQINEDDKYWEAFGLKPPKEE